MKRPVFLILGISFAVAGCAGGSKSATQATAAAQASAAAAPSAGEAVASDLPVYPGAIQDTNLSYTHTRCGRKSSATTYVVKDDQKTVSDWYAARIPGGDRVDGNIPVAGGTTIAITEIFDPSGARIASVSKTHFAANIPASAQNIGNAGAVHVVLETVDPAFSPSELQDAKAIIGSDPAARQRVLAKTKCGPPGT